MPQERILVVDDTAPVRAVIGALLERAGYRTTLAESGVEALARLVEGPAYDLVLCDVMMPGTDGLTLLRQIGIDHPSTPVVMITAVQDIQVVMNAFRQGAIDYLLKPFARAQLESVVARAIEQGRLLKQNDTYRRNLEEIVGSRTSRLRATMEDLERSYDSTLEAMGDALDLRDEETEGHSRRVTAYTIAIARAMGMNSEELKIIARGAFLHDIGKIATPDAILLKPGRLDEKETTIMRQHCERGYEIVRKIPFLEGASAIVYAHQERFDGTGYPRGLSGTDIPLGARIFAIADTLDAITSDRPYRKGASFQSARDEITRCAGSQFDPSIVEVFLRIPIESWNELRERISSAAKSSPKMPSIKLCQPLVAQAAIAG